MFQSTARALAGWKFSASRAPVQAPPARDQARPIPTRGAPRRPRAPQGLPTPWRASGPRTARRRRAGRPCCSSRPGVQAAAAASAHRPASRCGRAVAGGREGPEGQGEQDPPAVTEDPGWPESKPPTPTGSKACATARAKPARSRPRGWAAGTTARRQASSATASAPRPDRVLGRRDAAARARTRSRRERAARPACPRARRARSAIDQERRRQPRARSAGQPIDRAAARIPWKASPWRW